MSKQETYTLTSELPEGPIAAKQVTDAHFNIWSMLETVTDPEIPVVSLREMGILRAVRDVANSGVEVVLTPTYSGCPAIEHMESEVRNTLAQAGVSAQVVTLIAPAWSTDWMTVEAKQKLRAYGIAPPQTSACASSVGGNAVGVSTVHFTAKKMLPLGEQPVVPCPQCNSENTTETSHFGSTACKALYRCLSCMEPFDYFKPY